jgi:transposase
MIQITPHMRILLAAEPVDFRKGIDGLAGICRRMLQSDPFSRYLFVFINRRRTTQPGQSIFEPQKTRTAEHGSNPGGNRF